MRSTSFVVTPECAFFGVRNRGGPGDPHCVSIGHALNGHQITLRLDGDLAHVLDDVVLVRTLPAPVLPALRRRLQGVRLAGPNRPVSAGLLRMQRCISSRGVTQVAGRTLRLGFAHRHSLADADIPEATTLAQTIETWWPAVLAFLTTQITNAKTEGTNRLAKDVARRACGFRNPDNHQRRVRLHCTRHARRPTAGVKA
jgi:Transposase